MNILKTTSTLMICLATALSGSAVSASAESSKPRVAVPSAGASVDGCWTADRHLYGPYKLTFCAGGFGGGHYHVTGGGLDCQAGLNWFKFGGTYQFTMRRAHCGRHMDWTADTFSCSMTSKWDSEGRVAVPSPEYGALKCNYRPAVWTHPATKFSAYRS